jgi:hypothetical protein
MFTRVETAPRACPHCRQLSYIVSLALLCATAGCSYLNIEVAAYKGPLVETEGGRLAMATGLAKAMYVTAQEVARHEPPYGGAAETTCQSTFGQMKRAYEDLCIEGQSKCFLAGASDPNAAIRPLCRSLLAFADAAAGITTPYGIENQMKWVFFQNPELQRQTVALEESARIVRDLAGSVLADLDRDDQRVRDVPLSAMMASQSTGVLVETLKSDPLVAFFAGQRIANIYEQRYWARINTVEVSASGDTEYVLVKDEIGNWHLKKAVIDPTKIINAINAAVAAAVNIAGTASGLPLHITAPVVPGGQQFFDKTINDAVKDLGYEDDNAVLQDLKKSLAQIRTAHHNDGSPKMIEDLEAAIEQAMNRL